jgi:hypothetical protein
VIGGKKEWRIEKCRRRKKEGGEKNGEMSEEEEKRIGRKRGRKEIKDRGKNGEGGWGRDGGMGGGAETETYR